MREAVLADDAPFAPPAVDRRGKVFQAARVALPPVYREVEPAPQT